MLFDKRYIKFRDINLSDLYGIKLQGQKIAYNNIHFGISNLSPLGAFVDTKEFKLEFEKKDLLKCLVGDIELYNSKRILQKFSILKSEGNISGCWSFVSLYYYGFYCATLLSRIARNGLIYLNSEKASYLANLIGAITGNLIRLNAGNYSFKIQNGTSDNTLYFCFEQNKLRPHEALWKLIYEIFISLRDLDNDRSDDYILYESLVKLQSDFSFHSEQRNLINYRPEYALKSLNKEIFIENLFKIDDNELVKKIISFSMDRNNDISKQKASIIICEYIGRVSEFLFNTYKERSLSKGLSIENKAFTL